MYLAQRSDSDLGLLKHDCRSLRELHGTAHLTYILIAGDQQLHLGGARGVLPQELHSMGLIGRNEAMIEPRRETLILGSDDGPWTETGHPSEPSKKMIRPQDRISPPSEFSSCPIAPDAVGDKEDMEN